MQDLVLDSPKIVDFLTDLTTLSVDIVSDSIDVVCGVTLLRHKTPVTVASSGPEALTLDEVQYAHKHGPCLEAAHTGETVYVHDTATDQRWPAYLASVRQHDYQSILSLSLPLEDAGSAALNLYAKPVHAFTPELVNTLEGFATHSAKALRVSLRVAASAARSSHLTAAMESRTAIDMAVGVIMGQNKCTQAKAVEILTRASNTRHVKLRVLAEELIRSVSREPTHTHFD
ncbi:hypothetical protein C4K88_03970 [Arthrobacter pityocampae]|uniref:ANTAR domain-containing protein n=1 Tax=Arthrobacter pityocampae TaxID=547334 RepID=A0A2S5IZ91_9MICC|nr:GAF and ANTAR domain-containing protein [Arthrobacter pityocampae]PPB49857.1 hypothetical protein C4K88_03970 [Arthrobacter pityocampae]